MKKWLLVFLLVVSRSFSGTAEAQNITAQGTVTLNAGTQTSNPIDLRNTGTSLVSFTWSVNPTVSAGACQMQRADVTGGPWTNFGTPFTVTASGGPLTASMVVNYIRFTCPTAIVGTGSVGVRYVGTLSTASGTGTDVNVTNPSLVVTQSVAGNLNAAVTGTVTANAGTGFGVGQGSPTAGQTGTLVQCAVTTAAPAYTTGQTSPCSLDTTGGLRVSGISGTGGLGQGTTTAGQLGTLIQAAATTAAPTYTTGTTNPLSLDLTGALRVNVVATVGGGGGGGTSSNFTAAFPTAGTAAGFSDGANMQGARVYDANTGGGVEYVQGVNLRLSGAAGSLEFGTAAAPIRIDPVGTTTQPVSGTITANAGTGNFIVTQATAANLNATVTGTVTANAGTGFAGVAQGSTTAGQTGNLTMGAVTTAAPTYTTGQTNPLSLDTTGALRVNVVAGGGSGGGTSSNFAAAFPTAGTAAGFTDGANMQGARVFDVDSGAGTQYVQGVNLRLTGAGGSVEFGTGTAPIRIDPTGTTTQPVSGTVTANAGTGNFTVVQPTAANLNAVVSQATGTNLHVVVDTAPSTAVTGTVTSNAGTGWFLNQGSTTAGQTGSLSMCAVTTAAPTYTTAQTSPCSLDVAGNLRTVTSVTGTVTVNNLQWNGTTVSVNNGTNDAGTLRVVLATGQSALTTALNTQVTNTPSINLLNIGGNPAVTAANGVLRVAIADTNNNAITATADPCQGSLTTLIANSITADTQIIGLSGAGKKRYYCTIAMNNGGASNENVSLVESTTGGGTCTTAPSLVWGSTTDANGWLLASGGGGFISPGLKVGPLTNAATCLKVNTGGLQIDYIITYIDQ